MAKGIGKLNKYTTVVLLVIFLSIYMSGNAEGFSVAGLFSVISGPAISGSLSSQQGTLDDTYETYLSGWNAGLPAGASAVKITTVDGQPTMMLPWYGLQTSDVWTEANLHKSECGATGTFNDFCIVTDEGSVYYLGLSMSRNSALLSQQARPAFNMLKQMAKTSNDANSNQPYGITLSWVCRGTINPDGTGSISNCKKDFASDADGRAIIGTWNLINNPALVDTGLKNEMRAYVAQWCSDYKQYSYYTKPMKSPIDGRIIDKWFAGGGNVGRGLNNHQFMYPGYHGDAALAMMACGAGLSDPSYFTYADQTLEQYLIAGEWTPTSGLKIPACRSGDWSQDANGFAKYKGVDGCPTPPGTDNADAVRFTSMCAAEYFAEKNGITINNHISKFCEQLAQSSGYSPTAWSVQWYSTGTPKSVLDGGPHGTGLGGYVDLGTTPSNLGIRHQELSKKWNSANKAFYGQQNFGIYWGGFDVIPLGYGIGRADDTFKTGLSYSPMTASSGGGQSSPVCPSDSTGAYPSCTCSSGKTYSSQTNSCVTQQMAQQNLNAPVICPDGQSYSVQQSTCVTTAAPVTSGGGGVFVQSSTSITTTTTMQSTSPEEPEKDLTYFYMGATLFFILIGRKRWKR